MAICSTHPGGGVRTHWTDQSPAALFGLISTTMPPAAPRSLPPQSYADIEAYVLEANGTPAAVNELAPPTAAAQAAAARIVSPSIAPAIAPGTPQRAAQNPPPPGRPSGAFDFGRDAIYQAATARRQALLRALLATAGGVVFSGGRDRNFQALDAANGRLLWQTRLNASPSSSPITYSVGGKQYVAVVTGGGGPLDAFTGFLLPELYTPTGGNTLWVFRLPD
jgi:hypothetical protein